MFTLFVFAFIQTEDKLKKLNVKTRELRFSLCVSKAKECQKEGKAIITKRLMESVDATD